MKNGKSIFALMYLCTSCFLALFFMSFIFHVYFHWIGSDQVLMVFVGENIFTYLKIGGVGFSIGFVFWFFYYR